MTKIQLDRLTELSLRDAWEHEALNFTPWLAENLEQLSEVIGIPLELTGTEVAVETFSADILARSLIDDTVVLIENQLDTTDHKHLGQIMTYLAGLEAQTVVWIAPEFREPHLSAVRWLNEHTADGFSFFAVKLRVVRIGDSPIAAPVFEVVEKPNDWERAIRQKASFGEGAAYYDIKQKFWEDLLDLHPELGALGFRNWRYPNNYITVHDAPCIQVSAFIGKQNSGIFVRAGHGEPSEPVVELLNLRAQQLEAELGVPFGPLRSGSHMLVKFFDKGHEDQESWRQIMDWMYQTVEQYRQALAVALERPLR